MCYTPRSKAIGQLGNIIAIPTKHSLVPVGLQHSVQSTTGDFSQSDSDGDHDLATVAIKLELGQNLKNIIYVWWANPETTTLRGVVSSPRKLYVDILRRLEFNQKKTKAQKKPKKKTMPNGMRK